jgi:hypothetical protein
MFNYRDTAVIVSPLGELPIHVELHEYRDQYGRACWLGSATTAKGLDLIKAMDHCNESRTMNA